MGGSSAIDNADIASMIGAARATAAPIVKQSASFETVQRDLAIEPPNPTAVGELTAEQLADAITYNSRRFHDPYSIAVLRDVMGISRFPAVADEEFARTIAQWQAQFGLNVDGKAGADTTATIMRELRAEGNPNDANQLKLDNQHTVSTVSPITRTVPTPATDGVFRWDINFGTTLRNGWLIQEMSSGWNVVPCGYVGAIPAPTPHYWEAWWIDNNGRAQIPTSLATPPTTVPPAFVDRWERPLLAGTRGNFSINANLFSTLQLPPGFAFNAVPDAVDLPATTSAPASDRLGPSQYRRRATGVWNGCPPPAVNSHTGTP